MKSCYQLIKSITKFENYKLDISFMFSWKKKPVNLAKCETRVCAHDTFCYLHCYDMLTVPLTILLYCPITSMTRTLSYQCSNQAGDNQSHSRDKSVCTWHVLLLTPLWHVNCPFNHPITLSNYKHDTDIVLSVLKSGWW